VPPSLKHRTTIAGVPLQQQQPQQHEEKLKIKTNKILKGKN